MAVKDGDHFHLNQECRCGTGSLAKYWLKRDDKKIAFRASCEGLTQEQADAYLAEHPPQDERITEDWLLEIGFREHRIFNGLFYPSNQDLEFGWMRADERFYIGTWQCADCKTRHQLLALLAALGINTKEPG